MNLLVYDKLIIEMAAGDSSVGTTSPALHGASIGLYGQEINITRSLAKADLDAASMTFGGYAPKAITWGPVTIGEDGAYETLGVVSAFTPTGTDTTQLAWGCYVWDYGNHLLMAGQFDNAPLDMSSPMNTVLITLRHRPNATEPVNVIA